MTKALSTGQKAFRANVRAMKAIGRRNAKLRQQAAVDAYLAHVEAMNQRSVDAAAARAERRAAGIARRDAHNAALKGAAAAKTAAYEIAANRPVAMGDGYGVPANDVALAIAA